MLRKSLFLLVAAALLTPSAGCSPGAVELTAEDSGGQVEVRAGQQFAISLAANPSTGYTWEPEALDATMFEQVGEPEFEGSDPGLLGAGGILTLTFEALKPGTATLTLVYHRSWEVDVAPADTFSVTVMVK